jgi:Na+/proline symporter
VQRFKGPRNADQPLGDVGLCALAVALTLSLPASIFDRVLFSWSALGAAFGPVILMRVCSVEPRGLAILASILTGFALTVVFYVFGQVDGASMGGLPALSIASVRRGRRSVRTDLPWVIPLVLLFTFRQSRS